MTSYTIFSCVAIPFSLLFLLHSELQNPDTFLEEEETDLSQAKVISSRAGALCSKSGDHRSILRWVSRYLSKKLEREQLTRHGQGQQ